MILGSCPERIKPKLALLRASVGLPRRTLLVRLNASPRASSVLPSRILKVLDRAVSIAHEPGPGTLERPRLPKVPFAGWLNAAGLSQSTQRTTAGQAPP